MVLTCLMITIFQLSWLMRNFFLFVYILTNLRHKTIFLCAKKQMVKIVKISFSLSEYSRGSTSQYSLWSDNGKEIIDIHLEFSLIGSKNLYLKHFKGFILTYGHYLDHQRIKIKINIIK